MCSPVAVDVSLESTADDKTGGYFDVIAQTANGPLNVKVVSAPVDSVLHLMGTTSNALVRAKLRPTFEGKFTVRSSPFFGADVRMDEDQEDPAGKGRHRQLETRRVRKEIAEGKVTWPPVDEDKELGSVNLSTTNAPAHLLL